MEKVLLIVDDSKDLIEVVANILNDLFDRIVSVTSVVEAQKAVLEQDFSLMILDINLEGRNGAEVIKFLLDHPENKNNQCPVLILSGIVNEKFIERNESRFAGVLMKPFDHDQLEMMVSHIVNPMKGVLEEEVPIEVAAEATENASNEDIPEPPCELPFPVPELKNRVKNVLSGIKKNAKIKQLFAEMKIDRNADNYLMTHIGILINISTFLCIQLDWGSDKTLEKFVYAAYLHDMALSQRPDLAKIHGSLFEVELLKEKISPADFKLMLEHPNIAAKKLEAFDDVPADVEMIIRQHHELPKENGFPNKVGHNKITPLATLFIVAHDLTDFIMDNPKWTMPEYMAKAKAKFKGQHFAKALSALNVMT